MAMKVASGHLALPIQYPASGWTSESEAESIKDACQSSSDGEQGKGWPKKVEESGRGVGDHKVAGGNEEERETEVARKRVIGRKSQSKHRAVNCIKLDSSTI